MYHTLKTLHEWCVKHNSEITSRFRDLKAYCNDADNYTHRCDLNRGYKSLKWLIYTLRPKLKKEELQQVFLYCLIEAAVYGEKYLYDNVFKFNIARQHRHLLDKTKHDLSEYPVRQVGKWRVLINESPANITNLVFKRNVADVIIFRTPEQCWAGVIFNTRDTDIFNDFDIRKIYKKLKARGEPWILLNNLVLCGGPKAPDGKTKITTEELFEILGKEKKNHEEKSIPGNQ